MPEAPAACILIISAGAVPVPAPAGPLSGAAGTAPPSGTSCCSPAAATGGTAALLPGHVW